jgi:exodeoxyribonuclease-3
MQKEQMDEVDREIVGYTSYWNSSKIKKGYSGTAVFIKDTLKDRVINVSYDLPDVRYNQEGRLITVEFDTFFLVNTYFPNGGMGEERLKFKLDYYNEFLNYINTLRKSGKNII